MAHSNSGVIRSWNNFLNAFRLAMDSIRAQKLRSFLTLLGVIIGVASVIMVGAAIEASMAAPTMITLATPMMTPRRVRKLRSFCARMESIARRNALRKLFQERITPELL